MPLTIASNLSSYALAAGEPFVVEVQLLDSSGRGTDITDTAMYLSFYYGGPRALVLDYAGDVAQYQGQRLSDATGEYFRFAFDGRFSEGMYGKPGVLVELARRFQNGRKIIATGALSVVQSASSLPSLIADGIADTAIRVTMKANTVFGGAPAITQQVIEFNSGATPIPDPTPTPTTPTTMNLAAYGITDWTPGIGVNRTSAGQYAPSREYADLLADFRAATTVQQYFVDPVNGADGNNGATATPWQRIHTAWTQNPSGAATVEIVVRPPASRILWGNRGMTNSSVATKNIIVRAEDGGELIVAGGPNVAPPTWTDNGDGTYTCSSGVTNTVVSVPMDWSPQARAETTDGDGRAFAQTITASALDAAGRAALQPGQAHKNSGTGTNDLTIRPFGNRAASVWRDYVIPGMQPGSNFRVALFDSTPDSLKFWLSRVKPCGGTPFAFQNQRTTAGGRGEIYTDRCGMFSSSGTQNGQAVIGAWRVINFDPTSDAIGADALNAHDGTNGNAAWATGSAWVVHVRPKTLTVGLSGTGVDNSDTGHGNCRGLTIMPQYRGGNGRPYAWINTSATVCFGGSIGPSSRSTAQGYFESVSAGNTAKMALVETTVAASPNGNLDISADTGASVKCYGMIQGTLRTTGDVTFLPLAV